MAARTVDFLPEIFQTPTNRQFLAATLDQLTQEPRLAKRQGFIGRRLGPGVNPDDRYIVEPDKTRADYQLEPGVVSLATDARTVLDVMTYPGLNDAITANGGDGTRPDRLYENEYYSWDPFVDFDTFINYSQYYWLPDGPDPVTVAATAIPATNDFSVTRDNGVYTFSGITGNNPVIELVRGGNYNFIVAQNAKETINYRVRNLDTGSYQINGQSNPTLTLVRGNTYVFDLNLRGDFPFWIKTALTLGTSEAYNNGVSRNGSVTGAVTFEVPQDAPDILYYVAENQSNMRGQLSIIDATAGTGPGFWIQTTPGIAGVLPTTPNISNRDVFGVTNNGEDLGVINFAVPQRTAQQFFFDLPLYTQQPVNLITDLRYDQINNQRESEFLATYGGIDGIRSLEGRTLVFALTPEETVAGGWQRTTLFDPLQQGPALNGLVGSFDTTLYDQASEIPLAERYQVYQISVTVLSGVRYLQVNKIADIPVSNKFNIGYGDQYSNTTWYKDAQGTVIKVPLLTAQLDTLYYQDATDPTRVGEIRLVDQQDSSTLFVDRIIGTDAYTSSNGVTLTNGLKVVFRGDVSPPEYGSNTFSFTCTRSNAEFDTLFTLSTADLYPGQEIIFNSPTIGGVMPGVSYFVRDIINDFEFTLSTVREGARVALENGNGNMVSTAFNFRPFYVEGVGSGIQLLPVDDFVTPETYVTTEDPDGSTLTTQPFEPDYLTINRASLSKNPWSRSNRWFHINVINATAEYNKTVPNPDVDFQARRPILQFRPNIRLFNMGTEGIAPVDIIDFQETDAFSNIQGSTAYSVDGFQFANGSRVVFAADLDPQVRNKVYVVEFVYPDSTNAISQPIISLTPVGDGLILAGQNTVCLYGNTLKGKSFWFDGLQWAEAQQKTKINQAPLFDVYDLQGVSYGSAVKYPSTDFQGSPLFSYAVSDTGVADTVLGFALRYLSIATVGDIVFDNNLYVDSFFYTLDNVSTQQVIRDGTPREYIDRTQFNQLLGWQTAITQSKDYQQFKFIYDQSELELDIPVIDQDTSLVPVLKVYASDRFIDSAQYTFTTRDGVTLISINQGAVVAGEIVEVLALSNQRSKVGFYLVPNNLQNNPLNENTGLFTLGTVRQHYQSLCENLPGLNGNVIGRNNSRDLGNLVPYGVQIIQNSAPLTLAAYFMRSEEFNILESLQFNAREYFKFKNLILDQVTKQTIQFQTPAEILDLCVETLTEGRTENDAFYWSDMLPSGAVYTDINYTVSFTTSNTFDTNTVFNYTSANYLGCNVYLNGEILTRNFDYVVATDGPRIEVLRTLLQGDTITVREYTSTAGSFVPNTPTKLGAYPAFRPEIITIKTSAGFQDVIVGHDGSQTLIFGDIRDQVLLEFETRVFNNLKLDGNPVPISASEVIPGQFRTTGYSYQEVNAILQEDFLSYLGWNKLDYAQQIYNASNEFTYNYSRSQNKLDNSNLLGAWRGIYRFFYDTQQPQLTPWQMLGFSIKPSWWDDVYGVAPYTSGNLVLWDDLAQGLVRDPQGSYVLSQFARPEIGRVLPTGSQGELLPPLQTTVGFYDSLSFRRDWAPGDGSPSEASWWLSSLYPFAVMHLLVLTKPAKFFSLLADRDRYRYNENLQQFLYDDRFRLDANLLEIYGNGTSKASYIDWIVDYNRQSGLITTSRLSDDLANLDVRLCYRLAGFSDKRLIQLNAEKTSPGSTNTSLLLPDSTYDLLLYKNSIFEKIKYSAITVQNTENGYTVYGYNNDQPFFRILRSQSSGRLQTIEVPGVSVRVPSNYTDEIVSVPYGFEFSDRSSVADFLLSYGTLLERQGFVFDNRDNGYTLDWRQMAAEFLYWSQQGWTSDAILNLNPLASGLQLTRANAVADKIDARTSRQVLVDQNRRELAVKDLNITRLNNSISLQTATNSQTISYAALNYTSFEHILVLNNRSEFGDLVYDPATGTRQERLNMLASVSADWNGTLNAPGFILNQGNVEEWTDTRTYTKGEIVRYKGSLWSAATIVQPSASFDQNRWLQSDYEQIQTGLLPNSATQSDQLITTYDVNTANLEQEQDLFSYGLIGFRPRQYLAALNLGDVSQINVYRQFLGTKGTRQATDLLQRIDFGKEEADYTIYENWAVQRAIYGASANRRFIEFRLEPPVLKSNPSTIQIIQPQQPSLADQTVLIKDIWRQSTAVSNVNVFPTSLVTNPDSALPSAGYVNLDDVDITVFDLRQPDELARDINIIKQGTSIWAAKINDYDWNVYQAEALDAILQHVCDNLDQTSLAIFSDAHELVVGQLIIIANFSQQIDGVYEVLAVPGINRIIIAFSFNSNQTAANGTGTVFYLQTKRVDQFADATDLPYITQQNTPEVYVDDDGTGRWAVYERRPVLTPNSQIVPVVLDATEQYGSSIALSQNRFAALVGSPRYGFNVGFEKGAIYTYVKSFSDIYQPLSPVASGDALLTLDVDGVRGYGSAVTFGNTDWAAAGAPGSIGGDNQTRNGLVGVIYRDAASYVPDTNPYRNWQILTSPNVQSDESSLWPVNTEQGEMGFAVEISRDERWLYVGAPGVNEVYAYTKVDWQNQILKAISDGTTTRYGIQDVIQISAATQLQVTYNGVVQTSGVAWTIDTDFTAVTLSSAPAAGTQIEIARLKLVELDSDTYLNVTATGGTGSGARFTVVIRRNTATVLVQAGGTGYTTGDTLTISGSAFAASGWSSPANDVTFTVSTSLGAPTVISSINQLPYTGPGIVDTFDLGALFFQVSLTDSTIASFSIESDSVLLRPNIDYTFDTVTKEITFVNSPATGANILARAQDYWQFVAQLTVPGMTVASSVSTNTLGVGNKTFVTQSNLGYEPNQSLRVSFNDSAYMDGIISSYNNATGELVLASGSFVGSGSYSEWQIIPLDRFGSSIAATTDGSGIIVGAPNRVNNGTERSGIVYYFDRSVQRFVYGQDPSSVSFTVSGTVSGPVSVTVNGRFLTNQDSATINAPDTFTVAGNTVTLNTDLEVGDIIEIDTNQFVLAQTIENQHVEPFGLFGTALDICFNNCSLYIGEPGSSQAIYKGGQVERFVNQARRYGSITSTRINPTLTAGSTIRINNQEVAVPVAPNNTLLGLAAAIESEVPNVSVTVANGLITISVTNKASATPAELVTVAPGSVGTAFFDIGFETFVFTQEIFSPRPLALAGFGNTVAINSTADQLAVGANRDTMYIIAIWDDSNTEWDLGATDFFSASVDSGSVYLYDLARAANGSITNPDNFLFGQAVEISDLEGLDGLGTALAFEDNLLWIGAPGSDFGDSSSANYGTVYVWENRSGLPIWQVKYQQQDTVDIRLLNSVFLYDRASSATVEYLDFFNPLQGKILGAARQNLDYIGAVDPGSYTNSMSGSAGQSWTTQQLGQQWWNTSTVRFVDPSQDNIIYQSRRWGQIFPGSSVTVYQWIESTQPPALYQGPGTPFSTVNYSINTRLSNQGVIETLYYFWVQGLSGVAQNLGKTLSPATVASYIADPRASGISYLAPLNASTVALYNCKTLVQDPNTILHIEFDQELTNENVHVEWELIADGRPEDFLSDNLYVKLQDSLCGVDDAGNQVPDALLSPPERYGVQFRPRQSMFLDRFVALKNYIQRSNTVLARFPITETRRFNLLNSQDPPPTSAATDSQGTPLWNARVANLEILSFQNIYTVPVGYRYLVLTDSSQRGLWSIYTVVFTEGSQVDSTANRSLMLSRVQNYRTPDYWNFIDWYEVGYNSSVKPVAEVANFADLTALNVPINSYVKVTANSQNKFEIYQYTGSGYRRVGLEDGTIAISPEIFDYSLGRFGFDVEVFDAQYFDQEPVIETRKIIQAINQELFVDDLLLERNLLLMLMFNFALSEQQAPGWLTKTSLIDVDHRIRELLPFQNFNRDNQEFVIDYLQEVKPYHVQIKEFGLEYFGSVTYDGDVVDFDLPARFDTDLPVPAFVSPILLPYQASQTQTSNTNSDTPASSSVWQQWPYDQWFNNYLLEVDSIELMSGGTGYTQPPEILIQGDALVPATAQVFVNSSGSISNIILLTPGSGYRDQPTVVFVGGNGTGARAYVRLIGKGNAQVYSASTSSVLPVSYNLVRDFKTTIRFDRYQYQTAVIDWSPNGTYENGTLVRFNNRVWIADNADGSSANVGPVFRIEDWQPVPAAELGGVDRVAGFYQAAPTSPGLDLAALVPGISYPGVQVWADYFNGNLLVDADYSSQFRDIFLGTRVTDINVEGGAFVGLAEGHAPEELVNGSEFDTLDMRVRTRAGSDWQLDGHGFPAVTFNQVYNSTVPAISWSDLLPVPFQVLVSNQTTSRQLIDAVDYNVNYEQQTVIPVVGSSVTNGDVISVTVFGIGGGSQLYQKLFQGSELASAQFLVPVSAAEISEVVIFIDGVQAAAAPTWTPFITSDTWSILQSYPLNTVVSTGGAYYRSVQMVPEGTAISNTDYWSVFVPTLLSLVDMQVPPAATSLVSVAVLGYVTVPADQLVAGRTYEISVPGNTTWTAVGAPNNQVGTTFVATGRSSGSGSAISVYSYSTPEIQSATVDAAAIALNGFVLENAITGTNVANMIVTRNGLRLTGPACIEWIGDGSSVSFGLPQRLGTSFLQSSINAANDILVWVDDVLQTQSIGSFIGDFSVTPWPGSNVPGRQVVFGQEPPQGSRILIAVWTESTYRVVGGNILQLQFGLIAGSEYQIITWNDTSQQELLTLVFTGPVQTGITINEPFDSTDFDSASSTDTPGSFDYTVGTFVNVNDFDLSTNDLIQIITPDRLWVTLNGTRLYPGQDFLIVNNFLELASGVIAPEDTLVVTRYTDSIVPQACEFRIFQDMRGFQATYRITDDTSTSLALNCEAEDDVIFVVNAEKLTAPDLSKGIFGKVTIDGELITYRVRNIIDNSLSGLRRGVAGTAAASHVAGAVVTDINDGNLLNSAYQDRVISDTQIADGSTTTYFAPSITITDFGDSSSIYVESIEVFVGGVRQYRLGSAVQSQYPWFVTDAGGDDSLLTIEFFTDDDPVAPILPPPEGVQVTISQRQGLWWYDVSTAATRQQALQESDSTAARFLTSR